MTAVLCIHCSSLCFRALHCGSSNSVDLFRLLPYHVTSNPALRVCMSLAFLYNYKSMKDESNDFAQAIRHTIYPLTDECVEVPMDATMVSKLADITDNADAETENLIESPLHSRTMFFRPAFRRWGARAQYTLILRNAGQSPEASESSQISTSSSHSLHESETSDFEEPNFSAFQNQGLLKCSCRNSKCFRRRSSLQFQIWKK